VQIARLALEPAAAKPDLPLMETLLPILPGYGLILQAALPAKPGRQWRDPRPSPPL